MTLRTNARLAGLAYLGYIAVAFPAMVLMGKATAGEGVSAKLAGIAVQASNVRVVLVLGVLSCFAAIVLAAALYAITRDVDRDLALIALACRVGEGIVGASWIVGTRGLLWLATESARASDPAGANALGGFLLKADGWSMTIAATLFAVGSTIFSSLLVRGRLVPLPLAWLGVIASAVDAVTFPAQLAGYVTTALPFAFWLPMLVFEVTLGLWLIFKGVRSPERA